MRHLYTTLAFLIFGFMASAQQVPQAALDAFVKSSNENGFQLEKTMLPNFNRAHPNEMFRYIPCFNGKIIMVDIVMAKKPTDLQFKAYINNKVTLAKEAPFELTFAGTKLYVTYLTIDMRGVTSSSDQCLNLIAYDGDAIDMPVYIYCFSRK